MSFAPILNQVPTSRDDLLDFIDAARTANQALSARVRAGGRHAAWTANARADLATRVREAWYALTPDSTGSTDSIEIMISDLEDVAVTWLRENGR